MSIPPRIVRLGALTALASSLFFAGPAAIADATPPARVATTHSVAFADIPDVCESALPPEAHTTIDLIAQGGPFPYPQDGTVFSNREHILPSEPSGYYHEYTVETPGSPDRGARRIVTGEESEHYYTSDHYQSFSLVDFAC